MKDPIAGGYQMYLRQSSNGCRFNGLRLRGSNGIMVAGNNHLFDGFELESTMSRSVGGDDAFAIKAIDAQTGGIVIRNGLVRGYTAIASFGSEIGTPERAGNRRGAVRNVSVSNVRADRCQCLAYFKPGALVYDWRDGLVEDVELSDLRLVDAAGFLFVSGVMITAGRGAVIRGVTGRNLEVRARARSQGQLPTSAVDITLADHGRPAAIEDVDLQLAFVDPHGGARHGPGAPGYPIDHAVRIEKLNPGSGSMSGISLDISATGTRFGGIYVGPGLDDAVTIRRARLQRVATDPPAWMGGGGVWSDSRLRLQDVQIEALNNQLYSGRAFGNRRP